MKYIHGIVWGNPYTQPPDGLPRRLLNFVSDSHRPPEWLDRKRDAILCRFRDKGIYTYTLSFDTELPDKSKQKKWSHEAKVRNRLRRLRKRLAKKYSIPFLLEQAIEEAIQLNPDYYS